MLAACSQKNACDRVTGEDAPGYLLLTFERRLGFWPKQRDRRTRMSELRSCVKVEVAVLVSPSLVSLMVSVDVKQYSTPCRL